MAPIALMLSLLVLPAIAHAAKSETVTRLGVIASLIANTDTVTPGKPFRIALHLSLAPGWHTYWKDPGDTGAATTLSMELPPGAKAGPIEWPAPHRLVDGTIGSYGYTGDVLLPVSVTPAPRGGAMTITARATWLVCADTCVPEKGTFRLDLPAGTGASSAQARLFTANDIRMPRPSPFTARVARNGTLTLRGTGLGPASVANAEFFPDSADVIVNAAPQPARVTNGKVILRLKPADGFRPDARLSGVVVLRDASGKETPLRVNAGPGPVAPTRKAPLSSWAMIGFAVLGGLLLNLMPCVFPVLAIKAIAIARMSNAARREVRMNAILYTVGVLVAFCVLAAVLRGLRAVGTIAGWGFQFQEPAFVAFMAWLLFVIGLNLSGVFQIGGRLGGVGQGLAARGGHIGSFGTGLLAVLVATPCTVPFMGTVVAGALSAPAPLTLALFFAMGIGFAAPYGLFAVVPRLAILLPRPGIWMELLKQILAFPMYAASLWLVWIVTMQAGAKGIATTGVGLLLVGFSAWALGHAQRTTGRGRRIGMGAALVTFLLSLIVLPAVGVASSAAATTQPDAFAEPFSAARLTQLRAERQPVFVDMTAAWCVTCLVNERVALSPPAVRNAFAAHHVVYMRGDWTRQNPEITKFLQRYGRDGVPLYVFYPVKGSPKILPQILTPQGVLAVIAG